MGTPRVRYQSGEYRNEADVDANSWVSIMVISDDAGYHLVIGDRANVLVDIPVTETESAWPIVAALQQTATPEPALGRSMADAGAGLTPPPTPIRSTSTGRRAWRPGEGLGSAGPFADSGVA
jgi:hypothetical protein